MAVDVQEKPKSAPSHTGLIGRVVGVLVSPRATFENIVKNPKWFGMMAIVVGVLVISTFVFMSTQVGQQAMLDAQVKRAELSGRPMSDAAYQQMERMLPFFKFIIPGSMLIFGPLMTVLIAGILYGVFNVGMGGDATFKQVLAIVTAAGAVQILQQAFTVPLNYVRESMTSPTNLSVFVPMLDEKSFLVRVLGMIDLFFLWWIFVLAVGLAVLYRRRTQPIAVSLYATYLVIILAIAGVMSMF